MGGFFLLPAAPGAVAAHLNHLELMDYKWAGLLRRAVDAQPLLLLAGAL